MSEIEELLGLVDELTAHLQDKRELMRQMARCVREGRMSELDVLLQEQSRVEEEGSALNRARERLCERIAAAGGMTSDEVTLSGLIRKLDGPLAIAVNDRRERLLTVLQALLTESATTAHLVRYALDFNNKLMAILTGVDDDGRTYSPDGEVRALSEESPRGATGIGLATSTFQHSV